MNGSEPSVQRCVFQRESHLQGVCKLGSNDLHFNNFESL